MSREIPRPPSDSVSPVYNDGGIPCIPVRPIEYIISRHPSSHANLDRIRSATNKIPTAPLVVKSILKRKSAMGGKLDSLQLHKVINQKSLEDRSMSVRWADCSSKIDTEMFETRIFDVEDEECDYLPEKIWVRHTESKTKELKVEEAPEKNQCIVDGTAKKHKPNSIKEVNFVTMGF